MKGRIDVEVFFDPEGNRTCAKDFQTGKVCKYYRTQKFGVLETCAFAPDGHKGYLETLRRRGTDGSLYGNGMGYLIPGDWCPIEVDE